ncbi:Protein spire-like protein 2 [Bienertia sinuspersici]
MELHVLPSDKTGHLPVSTATFQSPTPVANVSTAASAPVQLHPSGFEVCPAVHSSVLLNNVGRILPLTTAHLRPQPPMLNVRTKNVVSDQLPVKTDSNVNFSAPQMTSQSTVAQMPGLTAGQTAPRALRNIHHPVQGMPFVHGPIVNHHVEVSRLVQKLLSPKLTPRSSSDRKLGNMGEKVNQPNQTIDRIQGEKDDKPKSENHPNNTTGAAVEASSLATAKASSDRPQQVKTQINSEDWLISITEPKSQAVEELAVASESGLHDVEWIGDADKVVDRKMFFSSCRINGIVYQVQKYALLPSKDGKLIPMKLQAMWEDSQTSSKWVLVHKCYCPDDLPEEVGQPDAPQSNEIYESTHDSYMLAGFVRGPCEVLPFRMFGEETEKNNQGI